MINMNANISPVLPQTNAAGIGNTAARPAGSNGAFADSVKAAESQIGKVDELQKASDASIKDLLTGKNEDINSVVSTVAKADMSFKLLVSVRNKLIEAYKETMNMPL